MPLEQMRHVIADRFAVPSCLEIGPRYLHSTGQLHKGGPNEGVFLLLSANEPSDLLVPGEDFTLGAMERAQAQGDMHVLSERGRRALHLHLRDNNGATLSELSKHVYMMTRKVASGNMGVRKPFSYQSINYEG
jgi:glucose-6-phosphate isomerase